MKTDYRHSTINPQPATVLDPWAPLRAKIGERQCPPFMFMGAWKTASAVVYTYKHRDSRRYLNLDAGGTCYAFENGYVPVSDTEAFGHVYS